MEPIVFESKEECLFHIARLRDEKYELDDKRSHASDINRIEQINRDIEMYQKISIVLPYKQRVPNFTSKEEKEKYIYKLMDQLRLMDDIRISLKDKHETTRIMLNMNRLIMDALNYEIVPIMEVKIDQ